MTSPLRHLPMSERAAVRSQIRRASKLPRYPHGHVMETLSVDASAGHLQWDDFIETKKRAFALPFLGAILSTKGLAAPFGNRGSCCIDTTLFIQDDVRLAHLLHFGGAGASCMYQFLLEIVWRATVTY